MPAKPPVPPADGEPAEAAPPQPVSKEELKKREQEEARLRSRRQKQELEKFRKEMGPPASKTSLFLGLLGIVGIAFLLAGGYAFWCFFRVNQWRRGFMDAYNAADLATIRKYAPEQYTRLDKLRQQAETGKMLTATEEMCKKYEEARGALLDASTRTNELVAEYRKVKASFDALFADAEQRKFDKHLPAMWKQVIELRAQATEESDKDFSPDKAVANLGKAVELLEEAKRSYEVIKHYDAAYSAFQQVHEGMKEDEWARNLADELAALQTNITQAEGAAKSGDWAKATELYKTATAAADKGQKALDKTRDEAQAVAKEFADALAATDVAELSTNDSKSWAEIQKAKKALADALAAFDYPLAGTTAKKNVELLKQTADNVKAAKESRNQQLDELAKAYRAALEHQKFFRINSRQEWTEIEEEYPALQKIAMTGEYVVVVQKAEKLKARIDGVMTTRQKLIKDTADAKTALDGLLSSARNQVLTTNFPELLQKVKFRMDSAAGAMARNNLNEALKAYADAQAILADGVKELERLEKETRDLRLECQTRATKFGAGMRAFRRTDLQELEDLGKRAEAAMAQKNYTLADPLCKRMSQLLPVERFSFDFQGAVTDNATGVMWARDGNGPGCGSGQAMDWYTALKWADSLSFAGFDDWRLPSDEELLWVLRLPEEARNQTFPNTKRAVYWSNVPEEAVDQALAVDFAREKTVRDAKKEKHFVRPVRSP